MCFIRKLNWFDILGPLGDLLGHFYFFFFFVFGGSVVWGLYFNIFYSNNKAQMIVLGRYVGPKKGLKKLSGNVDMFAGDGWILVP